VRTTVSSTGTGGAKSAPTTTSAGTGRRNSKRRQLRAEAAGGDAHHPCADVFPVFALASAGVGQVERRLSRNGLSGPLQVDLRDGGGRSIAGLITESDMDFVQRELAEAPCEVRARNIPTLHIFTMLSGSKGCTFPIYLANVRMPPAMVIPCTGMGLATDAGRR
jgi:hypothetical protein